MPEPASIHAPPVGWTRLAWLGPGLLWMVSAAGSGELLFTPRVGALYGYALLWALVGAVALKWFINREIGRYTVCTGATILEGFRRLPGPRGWALWLILVPQAVVAVATIAGLASGAATALVLALPGDIRAWTVASIVSATALVVYGRYRGVERVASTVAVALGAASVAAVVAVRPAVGPIANGLVPTVPAEVDYGEVLPWLGFMLSGAAGMIWYSYWIQAKGYGASVLARGREGPIAPERLGDEDRRRLRLWLRQMTLDNSVAVVGTLVITIAFLVLGVEILGSRGLVPEEERVAEVLGQLLGGVWGPVGFWFMVLGVFVGFWDTVLSDQDGFGRMFANGTRLLAGERARGNRWLEPLRLRRAYVVVLVTVLPILLYLVVGEPVALLKLAGAIEAAHIPVVAALALYLNRRSLPADLRPSAPVVLITALAALFFAAFALLYARGLF